MKEPSIKIGFIIFNENWKSELPWNNGHRKTAFEWIKKNGFLKIFYSVLGKNNINDEEDFLIEYIGAIKLYGYKGNFYCRVPRVLDINKTYFKKYYKDKGYIIIEDNIYENETYQKVKKYDMPYNRQIIQYKKKISYNPCRDGD